MSRTFVLLLAALVLVSQPACGARFGRNKNKLSIELLRERAEKHPKDPKIWTELAVAEQFEDGGEPKRAHDALEHAKKLGAKGLPLSFVEAEQHILEGRSGQALDAYLALMREAVTSQEDHAPLYAELAVSAVSDMNDAVDDYRARVEKGFKEVEAQSAKLGLNGAHQLKMSLFGFAMLRGDEAAGAKLAKDAGCVQSAQVAGPFGPRELLGFDVKLEAEKPGAFAKEYDLGPDRGKQPVRSIVTKRCVIGLGKGLPKAWPGTSVARSEIEITHPGDYALRIETPNSTVIWIDGKEVLTSDLRDKPPQGVRYVPVTLSAGKHELKVKLSSRHPNPALAVALTPGTSSDVIAATLPPPDSSLERFLFAKLSLSRGDAVSARELLRKKNQKKPTAHWLVLEAATSLADPLRPPELRRDLSREFLRMASQQNPNAWYPVVGLANLEGSEGRSKEAIEALRPAVVRFPDVIAIRTSLVEQLRERGYIEEAESVVTDLATRMPNACSVIGLQLNIARARGRVADVAKLTERAMACDNSSTARIALLRTQRKYDEAAAEYLRLRNLGDPLDEAQALDTQIEHAAMAGDEATKKKLEAKKAELYPKDASAVLDHADALLASGKRDDAVAYLAKTIEAAPDDLFELRRSSEALGAKDPFTGFRKDGDEVIRAYEASGHKYDQPQVLVLDYTVVRVFPDGSSADLTHNIIRVQSQESVDENGEFGIPEGARLLKLHTVKADGKKLEPEAISGKSTLSLPNLSVGDYVEFEMVRGQTPSVGFPGGYVGDRFYFQSFEVPFDHTELVVVLPKGAEPVLDPRGPAPETVRETRDGMTVLRWKKTESRPLTQEPGSVNSREFIPSIALGMKVSWEAYVESLRDLLADKDVLDPQALDDVRYLLGDAVDAPPSVRAQKLYRWVTEEIEPTDDVFGLSAAMLASRTGSRERVLRYMLSLAGVKSDLVLARGAEADHTQAKLPDPDTYGYLLLRVATENGPVWLHAGARHAPFGYLPPTLSGESAMVISPEAEQVSLPKSPIAEGLRSIDVDVKLAAEGSAKVHVRETHRGASAVGWRNDLDEIPGAELNARFEESYAVQIIPGASLVELKFEGRDNPEAPLVIDYTLDVASLGHRDGKSQRIPGLFTNNLSAQFARLGERSTVQLVGPPQALDVHVHVSLPKGGKTLAGPRPTKQTFADATFVSNVKVQDADVDITRSLRLPMTRVAPADYAKLAGFCRQVDLAEAGELTVALP